MPRLDGLHLILRWNLEELDCEVAAASEVTLVGSSTWPVAACATRNYERGVALVAIQQMLGALACRDDCAVNTVGDVHRGRLPARHLRHASLRGRTG